VAAQPEIAAAPDFSWLAFARREMGHAFVVPLGRCGWHTVHSSVPALQRTAG